MTSSRDHVIKHRKSHDPLVFCSWVWTLEQVLRQNLTSLQPKKEMLFLSHLVCQLWQSTSVSVAGPARGETSQQTLLFPAQLPFTGKIYFS